MKSAVAKLNELKVILSSYGGAVIAFSGGVDSTFLASIAHDVLKEKVLAVTASSETYPEEEIDAAVSLAQQIGLPHLLIHTEELADGKFTANPPERCYFCKKELFARFRKIAEAYGLPQVLDGTNHDDRLDYRPGMQAAKELGIKSPLLEAELTKEDIRGLSREMGIPTWNKPSLPCLASRFPYGEEITREKLAMVKNAEAYLRSLGLETLRVRHHGNLARIEVDPKTFPIIMEAAGEVSQKLRQIGYSYVTLDLQGFRSGSLNETL
ncbi:MAG: ATP-dependent sacrificial sulfur transferase LarE [Bacillota bacterium]